MALQKSGLLIIAEVGSFGSPPAARLADVRRRPPPRFWARRAACAGGLRRREISTFAPFFGAFHGLDRAPVRRKEARAFRPSGPTIRADHPGRPSGNGPSVTRLRHRGDGSISRGNGRAHLGRKACPRGCAPPPTSSSDGA